MSNEPMTKKEQAMTAVEYARHCRIQLDKWIDKKRKGDGGTTA